MIVPCSRDGGMVVWWYGGSGLAGDVMPVRVHEAVQRVGLRESCWVPQLLLWRCQGSVRGPDATTPEVGTEG